MLEKNANTADGKGTTEPVVVVDEAAAAAAKAAVDQATADAAKAASDKAAADKAAADAANAGKTPEQIAADDKAATDKAAADKAAADKAAADAEAAKGKGAPEKYDITIPDDMKALLDDADLKDLEGKARAKGLTNDELQAVVTARAEELAAQSAAFRAQTESDPIIGGDKLPETQRLAQIAMDRLHPTTTPAGQDFRAFLTKTGYGNHVQVVKHFATLGKMMAEDGHVQGTGSKPAGDAASKLYDKTPSA